MTVIAHERALTSVTSEHRTLDVRRDVARIPGLPVAGPWAVRDRELLLLELANGDLQHRAQHLGELTRANPMPQQSLRVAQVLVDLGVHGDLERVRP